LAAAAPAGQDHAVSRPPWPLDAALDLFVYAPVGLALTAAEEIPKLAAKGRARVSGQVGMARVVGQFAVAQGRREINKRLSGAASHDPDDWQSGSADGPEPGDHEAALAPEEAIFAPDSDGLPDLLTGPGPETPVRDGDGAPDAVVPTGSPPPDPAALAIPGYDSLAASQVVPRLAGLSPDELAAVGAYETSHRARRTILTRVRQLQVR
jgi:hypothetical protein